MGRVKFTPEIADKIVELHSKGLPIKYCAEAVGIGRKTVYNWLKKGEEAKSGRYCEFHRDMQMARADFIAYHHQQVASSKDWKAHQYLLQCVAPSDYVVEEKTKISADVKQEHSNLDEFARIMRESR